MLLWRKGKEKNHWHMSSGAVCWTYCLVTKSNISFLLLFVLYLNALLHASNTESILEFFFLCKNGDQLQPHSIHIQSITNGSYLLMVTSLKPCLFKLKPFLCSQIKYQNIDGMTDLQIEIEFVLLKVDTSYGNAYHLQQYISTCNFYQM